MTSFDCQNQSSRGEENRIPRESGSARYAEGSTMPAAASIAVTSFSALEKSLQIVMGVGSMTVW